MKHVLPCILQLQQLLIASLIFAFPVPDSEFHGRIWVSSFQLSHAQSLALLLALSVHTMKICGWINIMTDICNEKAYYDFH